MRILINDIDTVIHQEKSGSNKMKSKKRKKNATNLIK